MPPDAAAFAVIPSAVAPHRAFFTALLTVARSTYRVNRRIPVLRSVAADNSDGRADIRVRSTDYIRDGAIVPLRGPTGAGCGADQSIRIRRRAAGAAPRPRA